MSATSVTGVGHGASPNLSTSELNASINNINSTINTILTRIPSARYSTLEVTLGEEDPLVGIAELTLKDYTGNDSLTPCQLVVFTSTSSTDVIYNVDVAIRIGVEMVNGETDLMAPGMSVSGAGVLVLIPSHTDDYVANIEFINISETTCSGLYLGVLFPDGTYKISPTEIVLDPSEP